MHVLALLIALQQTSPLSGDTIGYWQQHVAYTITARLDEPAQVLHARATLRYMNHSPDTLREMYVHQYLNAFRPGSRWSRDDEREGRVRFQHLRDPDYGYERFTEPPLVNGATVRVDYPGAPDSTVAHFALPFPLAPGDSVVVEFHWDARPSTLPRRQGRRGRSWDFAQWYPKVAVYDRGGWEHNALRPAGEFYGEFGDYDVTLVVAEDQVIGATGVPVSGDPGWEHARRNGIARPAAGAYPDVPSARALALSPGTKAVRFYARDVHHFAWSTSPDYRYEGGVYVRQLSAAHWPTWDTVSVHVLYRPGDDTTWGGMRAVQRTINALAWLEHIYGPYAYPQMTNLHRIEGGGTEFPMMMMNGSASQGLILHEGGHNFTYGILANNEWRSGWMDEGLTSYQTEWAQGGAPQERLSAGRSDLPSRDKGYRGLAVQTDIPRDEQIALYEAETDLRGDAQPVGTIAHEFRDFGTYNDMIYTRSQVMYGQLRDVLGDSAFVAFMHDYYWRWALKHVDERAMRASAERVSGRELGWFFDQWVHHTGVTDYALARQRFEQQTDGRWKTTATIRRRGEYAHPVRVGVLTAHGWTLVQASSDTAREQDVVIVTADRPTAVQMDPFHLTWDWDRRNDVAQQGHRTAIDWPFLTESDRNRSLLLVRPMAWYSDPAGALVGARVKKSYLGWLDESELGVVGATRPDAPGQQRVQGWVRVKNPYWGFMSRPAIGWSGEAAWLDDIGFGRVGHEAEHEVGKHDLTSRIAVTYANAATSAPLPELWHRAATADIGGTLDMRTRIGSRIAHRGVFRFVTGAATQPARVYGKGELSGAFRIPSASGSRSAGVRVYGGVATDNVPWQRALYASADDPVTTFDNHWWRPQNGVLKWTEHWLPLGGAALRAYTWALPIQWIYATNLEAAQRLAASRGDFGNMTLSLTTFVDASIMENPIGGGSASPADAGVGLKVTGRLFDRPLTMRIDSPFFVNRPDLAIDRTHTTERVAPRLVVSFSDIW